MSVNKSFRGKLVLLSFILAIAIPVARLLPGYASTNMDRKDLRVFPGDIGGWAGENQVIPNPVLEKLAVDDYLMRVYMKGTERLWLYIGYYKSQKGAKTIHSPKHCYPGSGWQKVESSIIPVRVIGRDGRTRTISINRYLLEKGGERELVYYWYQSAGSVEASETKALMRRFLNAMFKNRTDGALVRVSTRLGSNDSKEGRGILGAIPLLYGFLGDYIPD